MTIQLQPGQFVFGRIVAAQELGMKPSTVVDCMRYLKTNNTFDIKSTNKFSVVTVVNWGLYQSSSEESDIKSDTFSNAKSDTNKKNTSYSKKKNLVSMPKARTIVDEYYDQFILKYGVKPAITGKMAKTLNDLVKQLGISEVTGRMKLFFADQDRFVVESKHAVEVFNSRINRYIVKDESKEQTVISYAGSNRRL